MNAPRDLGPDFRFWLHETPPMPPELPARTLDHTRHTRQRRRWLWFLPGRTPTAGADGRQDRAESIPTIASTGGIRTMFSATKLVGVAAAVALFGTLMLAVPFGPQQEVRTPAAEIPAEGRVTTFTSEMTALDHEVGDVEYLTDSLVFKPGEQVILKITSSDSRMSGVIAGFQNVYEVGPLKRRLSAWTGRLMTDGGSWLQSGRGYQSSDSTTHTMISSIGEGAYEGLTALYSCGQTSFFADWTCNGVITEVGWPEYPAEAPAEIPSVYLGQ